MQKSQHFIILTIILLGLGLFIPFLWPMLYVAGGGSSAPGFERITGIHRLPFNFITPGRVLIRWYGLLARHPGLTYNFDQIKNAKVEYSAFGSWSIEFLPDGTIFHISRSSNLHKMFSQDANKLLENAYLCEDSAAEEPFGSDSDNVHYNVIDRGIIKIDGRDTAWVKVNLERKPNIHDLMRGYKAHVTAFAAECPIKDKDELVSIYAISPGNKFNMEAAQKLFSLMKL